MLEKKSTRSVIAQVIDFKLYNLFLAFSHIFNIEETESMLVLLKSTSILRSLLDNAVESEAPKRSCLIEPPLDRFL